MTLARASWLTVGILIAGCNSSSKDKPLPETPTPSAVTPMATPSSSSGIAAAASAMPGPPAALIENDADHIGGVITRAYGSDGVFIADEDHGVLRWIADTSPLRAPRVRAEPAPATSASTNGAAVTPPASASSSSLSRPSDGVNEVTQETLAMGGNPANALAIRDGALVTVRDPGKLVRVRRNEEGKLSVMHEVSVSADAWGLAVNEAGTRVLVTSAWTNTVTLVDLSAEGLRTCAEVVVGREPRGVAFVSDGVAYVNHLVGNEITQLALSGECDKDAFTEVKALVVAPAPGRTVAGTVLPASLGYSLTLSPDKRRMFVPRHALGARSESSWMGIATVDVLILPDKPLGALMPAAIAAARVSKDDTYEFVNENVQEWSALVQPRDIRYRKGLNSVIVVSEGANRLIELNATVNIPLKKIVTDYELSDGFRRQANQLPSLGYMGVAPSERRDSYGNPSANNSCSAPQGVVLDAREETAMVFCRGTTTIARIPLQAKHDWHDLNASNAYGLVWAILGEDAGGKAGLNLGRKLFYSAAMGEGMGCAGCHPDGRDDGHVWREVVRQDLYDKPTRFLGGKDIDGKEHATYGVPRRTPMLTGRLLPAGPYGWRGESATLEDRIKAGSQLHAANDPPDPPNHYLNALGVFLRLGLPKPPVRKTPLNAEEQKGKTIFEDAKAACSVCHEPTRYFSNFTAMKLPALPTLPGFEAEPDVLYKTPSLLYVGRHGSLLHDGSAKTLEELIEANGTRMGSTAHLTPEERKALVAYLKTL